MNSNLAPGFDFLYKLSGECLGADHMVSVVYYVAEASKLFRNGSFADALSMYEKAANKLGREFFEANIVICNKKIEELGQFSKLEVNFQSRGDNATPVVKGLKKKANISEADLRSLYWESVRCSDYNKAAYALDKIDKLGANRKSTQAWMDSSRERLDNLFRGFAEICNRLESKNKRLHKVVSSRVAYVLHNSLPYSSGGYATRAHGVAQGLKEKGYEVLCVTRPGYPLDIQGDHTGKKLVKSDFIDGVAYERIFSPSRRDLVSNRYMIAASEKLKEYFIEKEVGVVIAASNHITAIPAGIAAKELGLPFFYEVRGFWEITRVSREPEFESTPQYSILVRNETVIAENADHVFTLTQPMKEELIKRGVSEDRISLLPNSCDPTRFRPRARDADLACQLGIPHDVPVIGYIGSFVQYEGLENLAQACAIIIKRGVDFRLILVGNENTSGSEKGPITEEILRVAKEEGLASKLIMPGRVPHEKVEEYYSLIDIAPFPRKPQPVTEMVSPMKPLEALSMEKAVLVSSVRALTEMIIPNKTGLVFEKGDIYSLADKLELLIRDRSLREKLGRAGREWVQDQRTWKKTIAVATDVIDNYIS